MSRGIDRGVDVGALLWLASQMRSDAELGFVVWGSGRLLGSAEIIEKAVCSGGPSSATEASITADEAAYDRTIRPNGGAK